MKSWKKLISLALVLVMALSLSLTAFAAPNSGVATIVVNNGETTTVKTVAAATVSAPQATVAHGYITDLKLRPSSDVEENIPGFSFTNGVASYDVTLADTNGRFILEFNVDLEQYKDLWWTVLLDEEEIRHYEIIGQIDKQITSETTQLESTAQFSELLPIGETHTLSLVVGKKNGESYTECDRVDFHIERCPGLTVLDALSTTEINFQITRTMLY